MSKHSIESTANKVMEIKFLKCFNSNISVSKPKAIVRAKLRAKLKAKLKAKLRAKFKAKF